MDYKINFDVYCSCVNSDNLKSKLKKYVLDCGGKFDYIEEGFIRKHITFYITLQEKYMKNLADYIYYLSNL